MIKKGALNHDSLRIIYNLGHKHEDDENESDIQASLSEQKVPSSFLNK